MSEQPSPMVLKEEKTLSANEVSGYMQSMFPEDAIRKCLSPISENARSRILMSQELSVYSNSEFVYAIFPIAISLFWGEMESPNCRVGTVVYDFHNSNTLSERKGYKQLFYKNKRSMVLRRYNASRVCPISAAGRLGGKSKDGPNSRIDGEVVPKAPRRSLFSFSWRL